MSNNHKRTEKGVFKMKATGIVRRIDDLGRVVIPKEIRRTLRIRDGCPLEIYTDADGGVVFRKYSLMEGLTDFSGQLCETLYRTCGRAAVITDRDRCIAAAGLPRKEVLSRAVSGDLARVMEERQIYQHRRGEPRLPLRDGEETAFWLDTAAPILSQGDVLGCVLFTAPEGQGEGGEVEYKLAQSVAAFLGRQMES